MPFNNLRSNPLFPYFPRLIASGNPTPPPLPTATTSRNPIFATANQLANRTTLPCRAIYDVDFFSMSTLLTTIPPKVVRTFVAMLPGVGPVVT